MNGLENMTILSNDDQPTSQSTTMIGLQDLSHPLSVSMINTICSSMAGASPSTYSSQNVDHYRPEAGGHCDYEFCTSQTTVDNNNSSSDRNKKFSISSIASVSDSGNESFIDEDPCDASSSNEKIVGEYFDDQDHKTVKLAGRNPTAFSCLDERYISSDDEEGESTLSESSYPSSPAEYEGFTPLSDEAIFDFETVCAAIDKKLIKPEATKAKDSIVEQHTEQNQHQNQSQFDDSSEMIEELHPGENRRNSFLIRSTSLKSGKTPPGTPGGKKIVRFADALGLDLASVRHIVYDQPYVPPLAAFKSLELDDDDRDWLLQSHQPDNTNGLKNANLKTNSQTKQMIAKTTLRMLFDQPSSDPLNFLERVRSNKVCLENCLLSSTKDVRNDFTLTCVVRVLNVCFNKKVLLRYTTNEWLTWNEVPGEYVTNSNDGFSDKFTIVVKLAVNSNGHQMMTPGQRLLFAIRFLTDCNEEYWDNNNGMNYAMIYQRC